VTAVAEAPRGAEVAESADSAATGPVAGGGALAGQAEGPSSAKKEPKGQAAAATSS